MYASDDDFASDVNCIFLKKAISTNINLTVLKF